ncbi:NAD synthetase / Glutamine amidotransferase chain of NAD synthetase [Celeribacter marinus]|uniref:Glutamine-dependent NAD(+) synthetase n=2 Tax=Celeribacter marinus TaxID=1397108 RepID=A0A0N7HJ21_9RHOB|nr:NAD synthetase / Glutamine amidotransferase chain of NAD synthetase [Celeribacter marinus]
MSKCFCRDRLSLAAQSDKPKRNKAKACEMTDKFRLTMAQLNPVVGAIDKNADAVRAAYATGKAAGSDYVVFPELFVIGYQPQDLVKKPALVNAAMAKMEELAALTLDGPAMAVGAPYAYSDALYNGYWILAEGQVKQVLRKHRLPNFNVFDEKRLFAEGPLEGPYAIGPMRIGSPICEDAWHEDVAEAQVESGAEILIVPNGSPYFRNKFDVRLSHMVARVTENDVPLVYLNMVGGQDDQVFDGGSFVLNRHGKPAHILPAFDECIRHVDFVKDADGWVALDGEIVPQPDAWEQDYRVMVEALRDYLRKTGFKKVVLGLSGGIDSAIVATIATDALGPDNVHCVMLPSEYTSQGSLEDAKDIAERLGCRYDFVPISEGRDAITDTLAPLFAGYEDDLTEENLQSRLRGLLLMALSNKFGSMLLTTGNKSEVAVGYCTIYGDMNGGYNPIKDLYKTRVFEQCRWRNANHRDWMMGPEGEVIPVSIIDKPPSAELRPDQRDDDSLPPYEVLDAILEGLVDRDESVADLVAKGFERDIVKRVEHLLYISEYKRFQSAPGPRLTHAAFWLDRRYPIVNGWRDPS